MKTNLKLISLISSLTLLSACDSGSGTTQSPSNFPSVMPVAGAYRAESVLCENYREANLDDFGSLLVMNIDSERVYLKTAGPLDDTTTEEYSILNAEDGELQIQSVMTIEYREDFPIIEDHCVAYNSGNNAFCVIESSDETSDVEFLDRAGTVLLKATKYGNSIGVSNEVSIFSTNPCQDGPVYLQFRRRSDITRPIPIEVEELAESLGLR